MEIGVGRRRGRRMRESFGVAIVIVICFVMVLTVEFGRLCVDHGGGGSGAVVSNWTTRIIV